MQERHGKAGPILLWTAAGILTAAVLGWYMLDRPAETSLAPLTPSARRAGTPPLDLNTATVPELEELPGIGPALAEQIVAWREENGPFAGPEDVTQVPGIGPATYEAIAPYIEDRQEETP